VHRNPLDGPPFEALVRELREALVKLSGLDDVTRTFRRIRASQPQERRLARHVQSSAAPALAEPEPPPPAGHEDIERARNVVASLLPSKPPQVQGMDVAVFSRFRHEVGGDYYDFLPLPDGRLAIAIADVSGKGVAAAIVMVMLREILHMMVTVDRAPVETMAATNSRLARDMPRGMFVTFLYTVLDPRQRELRLVNAGHCPPIMWRPRLTGARMLTLRGPALGMLGPEPFAKAIVERTLKLEPSDCLCLFTDGVSEAKNLLGEDFGERRLASVLRNNGHRPAKDVAEAIIAAVDAHSEGATQHDDMTLIVLKVT